MRSAALVLAGLVVAAVAVLAVAAVSDQRDLAFTLGVNPAQVAAPLNAGQEVCQGPVDVPERFRRVQMRVGTFGKPGPPLAVTVRAFPAGLPLARGTLRGGYPDSRAQTVTLQSVAAGGRVSVCVRNVGRKQQVALYGGAGAAARTSTASIDGRSLGTDLTLVFKRDEERSVLSLLPTMFERASLFHPGWAGPWLFWTMLAALLLLVPLLLWRALDRAAGAANGPSSSYSSRP
jgi:hypothetical protein